MCVSHNEGFDCEVAIVGAGMVGGALGCALGQQGFNVALVELREPEAWSRDKVDQRVSALTRASQHILESLGVWDRMSEMRVSPYRGMSVWDATGSGSIEFDAADIGEPDLGHIVENRVTQLALWERLAEIDGVSRFCPESVSRMELGGERPWLELSGGKRIEADLIVAADGANSTVRELAGIACSGWQYDQHALVATVYPEKHHQEIARQRFMPTGPLALLPIEDGSCSIVWSTLPDHADFLLGLDGPGFCRELEMASQRVLGGIESAGPRTAFPLGLRHADHYVSEGVALIGDAAHGIHPLAGQGVNLGFLDAAVLVDVLQNAKVGGRPLGSYATLRRYERGRKGNNLEMLALMDLFKRVFSNRNKVLTALRNLGLNLADASGPLKRILARRAMGLSGDLPSLAVAPAGAYEIGKECSSSSHNYPRR